MSNSTLNETNEAEEGNQEILDCIKATNLVGIGVAFLFVLSGNLFISDQILGKILNSEK